VKLPIDEKEVQSGHREHTIHRYKISRAV
jgi:hypothetical protein